MRQEQEVDQIVAMFGPSHEKIYRAIESQFSVMSNRAQILLGLSGVVITTTGFSGRLIAGTNATAQIMVICGVSTVLSALLIVVLGVMPLKWLTQQGYDGDVHQWLHHCLAYRNRKLRLYRIAIFVLVLGITFYVIAISIMLLYPMHNMVPNIR